VLQSKVTTEKDSSLDLLFTKRKFLIERQYPISAIPLVKKLDLIMQKNLK